MLTVLAYPNPPSSAGFSILEWWLLLRQSLPKDQKMGLDSAVMLVSWSIWKEHTWVFNNTERNLNQLLSDILSEGWPSS